MLKKIFLIFIFSLNLFPLGAYASLGFSGPDCDIVATINKIEQKMTPDTTSFTGGEEPFPYYLLDVNIKSYKSVETNINSYNKEKCDNQDIQSIEKGGIIINTFTKPDLDIGDTIKAKVTCGGGTISLDGCFIRGDFEIVAGNATQLGSQDFINKIKEWITVEKVKFIGFAIVFFLVGFFIAKHKRNKNPF